MWFSSVLRWLQGTSKSSPRGRPVPGPRRRFRPSALEELGPCPTPAEVGLNDFRLSFMGPDGNPNFGAFESAVAYNSRNHEYLFVWSGDDFTDEEFEIFGQRIDAATGALLGGKVRLSDLGPDGNIGLGAFAPAVAYNGTNNEYFVVWAGNDNTGTLGNDDFEIFGQRLDAATGALLGGKVRLSGMGPGGNSGFGAFDPDVTYNGANNEYLVVWHGGTTDGGFKIFGQRLNAATGAPLGANDFRISDLGPDGNPDFDASSAAAASNGAANDYLVGWEGDDDTAPEVDNTYETFGRRFAARDRRPRRPRRGSWPWPFGGRGWPGRA